MKSHNDDNRTKNSWINEGENVGDTYNNIDDQIHGETQRGFVLVRVLDLKRPSAVHGNVRPRGRKRLARAATSSCRIEKVDASGIFLT